MAIRALTYEQEHELAKRYQNGESSKDLCDAYNLKSTETVRNIVRRCGNSVRVVGKSNAKYNVNHNYFANGIRTENSARLLGLLLTDGSIHCRYANNKLIHFGSTDKELSEFVHAELGGKLWESATSVGTPYYRVATTSAVLFDMLSAMGFTPCKSKTIELSPNVIPDSLRLAFLVGLIEGDGSILKQSKSIAVRIEFCTGSERFASQFAKMFPEFSKTSRADIHCFVLGCNENPSVREFFEQFNAQWIRLHALPRKGSVMTTRLNTKGRRYRR